MKYELVYHGVPRGHQVWGGTLDKYYETFYGSEEVYRNVYKDVKALMILEIRKFEGKYFSYYTFINYKNVIAEDGRPGSYFAMTFKVEGHYCTAVHYLYDLLSQVYNKYVLSEVLSVNGDSQKYKIDKFELVSAKLTAATNIFTEQINTNFANDFEEIDANLVKKYAERNSYYNLNDVDSKAFFDSTLSYGKILISPDYAAKDVRLERINSQLAKQNDEISSLKVIIEQLETQNKVIPSMQDNLKTTSVQIGELSETIEKYKKALVAEKAKVSNYELQIKDLSSQLQKFHSHTTARELIQRIEQPLCELAEIARMHKQQEKEISNGQIQLQPKQKKPFILYSVIVALVALLIGLSTYTWLGTPSSSNVGKELQALKEELVQLDSVKTKLEKDLEKHIAREEQIKKDFSNVKIDMVEYRSGDMKVGNVFTAVAKNAPTVPGIWKIDGFSITDKENPRTSVTVMREGDVVISYYIHNVKVATRTFKAVK